MADWSGRTVVCDGVLTVTLLAEIAPLKERVAELEAALIEKEAELIYLRSYGKDGAIWSANDSKDVWRDKARAALEKSHE